VCVCVCCLCVPTPLRVTPSLLTKLVLCVDQIVEALKTRQIPVAYVLAHDEGHGFRKKKNQDFLLRAFFAFVREHVLDEGPPTTSAVVPLKLV
jgi:hypothetical protein